MTQSHHDEILLAGFDGCNPLAYLAALGTLRTVVHAMPDKAVQLSWRQHSGAWRPIIHGASVDKPTAFVEIINNQLKRMVKHPVFSIGDNLNLPVKKYREKVEECLKNYFDEKSTDIIFADFIASFGSEVPFDAETEDPIMEDTALRTMSGAGHQHFLKFFRDIAANTHADHLQHSLFDPWDYCDEGKGLNLRWDPADDRRYALRWHNPSKDPSKTMRGANRLAMEALPLLPTMPTEKGLATTSFEGSGSRNTYFIMPIWNVPASLPVVKTILGFSQSFKTMNVDQRNQMGIADLFRSQRITIGKFRNFTPAQAL